jgi:hypothetical protein
LGWIDAPHTQNLEMFEISRANSEVKKIKITFEIFVKIKITFEIFVKMLHVLNFGKRCLL